MFQNLGENQIKEIINAAKFSIFFIDEDQRVTLKDIGEKESIKEWATSLGATVHNLALQSQFRCNGADGYLAWLDNVLEIRETANETLDGTDYDFQVFDTPNQLRDAIFTKNQINNKARLVAGYCWNWVSKKDASLKNITLDEHDFAMKWNLSSDGTLWIIKPDSVNEIGCIHTCQGLETDYIGVIIGPDFVIRDGVAITDAGKRAKTDASIKGYKKLLKEDAGRAKQQADAIIKNTYRTLMTRGMKGCYIYCTDSETNAWFKQRVREAARTDQQKNITIQPCSEIEQLINDDEYPGLTLRLLETNEVDPYENAVPIYNLEIAAGQFSDVQTVNEVPQVGDIGRIEQYQWVELPDIFRIRPGHFVARVVGESMNKRIPNGAWCLFNLNPGGSRQGKVILVQHHSINDSDTGGHYTIKLYQSEKVESDEGGWQHARIILRPDSTGSSYTALVFDDESARELTVIAEMVAVLG